MRISDYRGRCYVDSFNAIVTVMRDGSLIYENGQYNYLREGQIYDKNILVETSTIARIYRQ